eukprot:Rmarinus@m.14922
MLSDISLDVGNNWSFEIFYADDYGNSLVTASKYRSQAVFTDPNGFSETISSSVSETTDLISYSPFVAGEWTVSIWFDSFVVYENAIYATPTAPDAASSMLWVTDSTGDWTTQFVLDGTAYVHVQLYDEYGNIIDGSVDYSSALAGTIGDVSLSTFELDGSSYTAIATGFDVAGFLDIEVTYDGSLVEEGMWQVQVFSVGPATAIEISHGEEICISEAYCPDDGAIVEESLSYSVVLVDASGNVVAPETGASCSVSFANQVTFDTNTCSNAGNYFHVTLKTVDVGDYEVTITVGSLSGTFMLFLDSVQSASDVSAAHSPVSVVTGCSENCECVTGTTCGSVLVAGTATVYRLQQYTVSDIKYTTISGYETLFTLIATDGTETHISGGPNTDGSYTYNVAVTVPGSYVVSVLLGSEAVVNSGFLLEVTPSSVAPANSVVTAANDDECLSSQLCGEAIAAGATSSFAVELHDEYGNSVTTSSSTCHLVVGGNIIEGILSGSTCSVPFTTTAAATHDVSLYVDDVFVVSFKVLVTPGSTSALSVVEACETVSSMSVCATVTAGSDTKTLVLARDSYGNDVTEPSSSRFQAVVTSLESSVELTYSSVSLGDGTELLTFVETAVGSYSVVISYAGEVIQGGEFLVEVVNADALQSASYMSLLTSDEQTVVQCQDGLDAACLTIDVDESILVLIVLFDQYGNVVSSSSKQVVFTVSTADDGVVQYQSIAVYDEDNGVYATPFRSQTTGKFVLETEVGGVALSNSPILVEAISLSIIDIGQTTYSGWGATRGTAGEATTFDIEARDSFGNPVHGMTSDDSSDFLVIVSDQEATVTFVGDGVFEVTYTLTKTGFTTITVYYKETLVDSWDLLIMANDVNAANSEAYLGTELCITETQCGCSVEIGSTQDYSVLLKDSYGNEITESDVATCSYEITAIGVDTVSGSVSNDGNYCILPLNQEIASVYSVAVTVRAGASDPFAAIANSGFKADFIPRDDLDVNATYSFVTDSAEMQCTTEVQCDDDLVAGVPVQFSLHQVSSTYDLVHESSGLLCTFILQDTITNHFTIGTGIARADGTYDLDVLELEKGTKEIVVYLGATPVLNSGFLVTVIPAPPSGANTQIYSASGTACEEEAYCQPSVTEVGFPTTVYTFHCQDVYGNLLDASAGNLTITAVETTGLDTNPSFNVTDHDDGSYSVSMMTTTSGDYEVYILLDEVSEYLLGSGYLLTYVSGDGDPDNSAAVFCSDQYCRTICQQSANCPTYGITAGKSIVYGVSVLDRFENPVEGAVDGSFTYTRGADSEMLQYNSNSYKRYVITETITVAGTHEVTIEYESSATVPETLQNAPFNVLILAGNPDSAQSKVYLNGERCVRNQECYSDVKDFYAGTTANVVVATEDEYGNERSCSNGVCTYDQSIAVYVYVTIGSTTLSSTGGADGLYSFNFALTVATTRTVDVSAVLPSESFTFSASPFTLNVLPATVKPSTSFVMFNGTKCNSGTVCRSPNAGHISEFGIQLRDRYGNDIEDLQENDDANCAVDVYNGNTGATVQFIRSCSLNHGVAYFSLQLQTVLSADYRVTVKLNTYSIQNPTFYVDVVPDTVSPSNSLIYLTKLAGSVLDEPFLCEPEENCYSTYIKPAVQVGFEIQCRDSYSNSLTESPGGMLSALISRSPPERSFTTVVPTEETPTTTVTDEGVYLEQGTDNDDGTYSFTSTPQLVGVYDVNVLLDFDQVGDSFWLEYDNDSPKVDIAVQATVENGTDIQSTADELALLLAQELGVSPKSITVNYEIVSTDETSRRRADASTSENVAFTIEYATSDTTEAAHVASSMESLTVSSLVSNTSLGLNVTEESSTNTVDSALALGQPDKTDVYFETANGLFQCLTLPCPASVVDQNDAITDCFPCPYVQVPVGVPLTYQLYVADEYRNHLSLDYEWGCKANMYYLAGNAITGCDTCSSTCSVSSNGNMNFTVYLNQKLDEDLLRVAGSEAYELSYVVVVTVDDDEIELSPLYLTVGDAGETDVERSSLTDTYFGYERDAYESGETTLSMTAGEAHQVFMQSRDSFGNLRMDTSDQWTAKLVPDMLSADTNPAATSLSYSLSSYASGVYSLDMTPTLRGSYNITLKLFNTPKPDFFLEIEVLPTTTDPDRTTVVIDTEATAGTTETGTPAEITITFYDQYGNRQNHNNDKVTFDIFNATGTEISGATAMLTVTGAEQNPSPGVYYNNLQPSLEEVGELEVVVYHSNSQQLVGSGWITSRCPRGMTAVGYDYWQLEAPYKVNDPLYDPNEEGSQDRSRSLYECEACPEPYTTCDEVGLVLRTMTQNAGFWRRDWNVLDFDECLNLNLYANTAENECKDESVSDCQPCRSFSYWGTGEVDGETVIQDSDVQCRKGYTNRLCSLCESGYTRLGYFECGECMSYGLTVIYMIGVLLVLAILIGLYVMLQLKSDAKDPALTIATKIFMSYFQVVSFARYIDFEWPDEVVGLFDATGTVFTPSTSVLSLDCLLDGGAMGGDTPVFFKRLKITVLAPIVLVVGVLLLFWISSIKTMLELEKDARRSKWLLLQHNEQSLLIARRRFREARGRSIFNITSQEIETLDKEVAIAHRRQKYGNKAATGPKGATGFVLRIIEGDGGPKWMRPLTLRLFPRRTEEDDGPDPELIAQRQHRHSLLPALGSMAALPQEDPAWVESAVKRIRLKYREEIGYRQKAAQGKAIVAFIVLFFFIHPSLTAEILRMFGCKTLADGESYVLQSMDTVCYEGEHLRTVPWGIAGVLIYVLGIPLAGVIVLYTRRHALHPPIDVEELGSHLTKLRGIAFSPTGPLLATAGEDGAVRVYPVASANMLDVAQTFVGHQGEVTCVTCGVLDVRSNRRFSHAKHLSLLTRRVVVSGSTDNTIRVWDAESSSPGNVIKLLLGHRDDITCLANSADLGVLVSGSKDTTLRTWDVQTGECDRVFFGHECPITCVALVRHGFTIVSGGMDGCVRVWNAMSGACLLSLESLGTGPVTALAVAPYGTSFCVAHEATIRMLDAYGRVQKTLEGQRETMNSIAYVPGIDGGDAIAFCGGVMLGVWEVDRNMVMRRKLLDSPATAMSVSSDGTTIGFVTDRDELCLWKLEKEKEHDRVARYMNRQRYGFLYLGFRLQFYWWEVLIMLRKILVVCVTVFMSANSVTSQGFCLIGLNIIALILHLVCQPYSKVVVGAKVSEYSREDKTGKVTSLVQAEQVDLLNQLETVGILGALLTILLGMYLYQEDINNHDSLKVLFTVFVFILNIGVIYIFLTAFWFLAQDKIEMARALYDDYLESRKRAREEGKQSAQDRQQLAAQKLEETLAEKRRQRMTLAALDAESVRNFFAASQPAPQPEKDVVVRVSTYDDGSDDDDGVGAGPTAQSESGARPNIYSYGAQDSATDHVSDDLEDNSAPPSRARAKRGSLVPGFTASKRTQSQSAKDSSESAKRPDFALSTLVSMPVESDETAQARSHSVLAMRQRPLRTSSSTSSQKQGGTSTSGWGLVARSGEGVEGIELAAEEESMTQTSV